MRRRDRYALIPLIILAAAGCASSMNVSSHVDRGLDFSRYGTYDWGPADALPTGDPRLDQDPFFKDQVQGAVERQLAARGLELATSGTPDLLIHYHAHISQRIDPTRVDRAYGYWHGDDHPVNAMEYEAGTLVLDLIDARTKRLIWRGWAQDSVEDKLDDRDAMARAIDEAVSRMLRQLPAALQQ